MLKASEKILQRVKEIDSGNKAKKGSRKLGAEWRQNGLPFDLENVLIAILEHLDTL